MKSKIDPLNFKGRTRIEVIRDFDEQETREERRIRREGKAEAQNAFMRTVGQARERMEEINDFLDDHLGFAPDEITPNAVEIAKQVLAKLEAAMTIAEQTDDLNQALHQADKDNPARS